MAMKYMNYCLEGFKRGYFYFLGPIRSALGALPYP